MGTRKGCYQCTKRRIVCDMTEPRCQKCSLKGLECSGNGLHYRFNDGIASRGKFRGLNAPTAQVCQQKAKRKPRQTKIVPIQHKGTSKSRPNTTPSFLVMHNRLETGILPCLESASSHSRRSFDYFSTYIAPGMVVLDDKNNGYRSIILPFAAQDELVRMAVTSITSCRLSRKASGPETETRATAEMSRAKVIEKLMQQSTAEAADAVFTVSSWMAVLVLLVGELVLGGDQYAYLLRMMRSMKRHGVVNPNSTVVQFLQRQTDLILLLAQPFVGSCDELGQTETYSGINLRNAILDSQNPIPSITNQEIINIVAEAGEICYDASKRCSASGDPETHQKTLNRLKGLVSQVPPCTAGGNSLIWVYFIGAADSETVEDYIFFTSRLADIYDCSGWDNIASGLSVLGDLWQRSPSSSWSHVLPEVSTAFVM